MAVAIESGLIPEADRRDRLNQKNSPFLAAPGQFGEVHPAQQKVVFRRKVAERANEENTGGVGRTK